MKKLRRCMRRELTRSHHIDGRDDGPKMLQRRISIQVKDATKLLDVEESISDMDFIIIYFSNHSCIS